MLALIALVALEGAAAKSPNGPINLTLYRVSPLDYPGLVDMDTGTYARHRQHSSTYRQAWTDVVPTRSCHRSGFAC